jgi:hypothetical protein
MLSCICKQVKKRNEVNIMKVKELKEILSTLKDDAEICIVDNDQDNSWDILECRTCEDKSSEFFGNFLDIVIKQ